MPTAENPHAGQGPVLLDIGGDVGALVVTMPPGTAGLEVAIRPAGASAGWAGNDHLREHSHSPGDEHSHEHGHSHGTPYPHVGVVGRPTVDGTHYSLVYPAVTAGDYELCPIPGDDVVLTATVVGGEVTELDWPR